MKSREVIAGDFCNRLDFARASQSVRVRRIHHAAERACCDRVGLCVRFLQCADETHFLTLQHFRGKLRLTEHRREQIERLPSLFRTRERAHPDAGAVRIETAVEVCANVSSATRDLVFVEASGAQPHHARSQIRKA
jgi:hypothetical protein